MNPLNKLDISPKIRRMIDLVLKQDPRYFIRDEVLRLDRVIIRIQVVILQRAGRDSKL